MKNQLKRHLLVPLLLLLLFQTAAMMQAHAQQHVVQLSGLVTSADSLEDMASI